MVRFVFTMSKSRFPVSELLQLSYLIMKYILFHGLFSGSGTAVQKRLGML